MKWKKYLKTILLDSLLYIVDWVCCSHKWLQYLWRLIRVGHHESQSFPLRDFHLLLIGHHWLWDRIVGGLVEGLCHRERRDDNIKMGKDGLQLPLCFLWFHVKCLVPVPVWEHLSEGVELESNFSRCISAEPSSSPLGLPLPHPPFSLNGLHVSWAQAHLPSPPWCPCWSVPPRVEAVSSIYQPSRFTSTALIRAL